MSEQSKENTARKLLGFTDAVAEYIAPVLLPYGFVFVSSTLYSVEFASSFVRVLVTHEPLSYELDIDLIPKACEANKISLSGLIYSEIGPMPSPGIFFQSSNRSGVASSTRQMAALLARFGRGVLTGDAAAFKHANATQSRLAARYWEQFTVNPIREQANEAWRRRDFKRVCELYQSVETKLTPSEKKRLTYARKFL